MTAAWPEATFVLLGAGARAGTRATIVVDAQLRAHDIVTTVVQWLGEYAFTARVVLHDPAGDLDTLQRAGLAVQDADVVVAVGGGTVLDQVKLATLLAGSDRVRRHLEAPQRSGLVLLPVDAGRHRPLVAVPTTLGTGAESSAVSVLAEGDRQRLVMGPALRPEAAVIDPRASAGLPTTHVREGALEVLSRLLGPYVGDHTARGHLCDDLVETAVRRIVQLGDVAGSPAGATPATRHRIALVGAFGHSDHLQRPHSPWGSKLWPLANGLSTAAGVRKMTATAALWPHVWRRVLDGDRRLGSDQRLRHIWSIVADAHAGALERDPALGIAELIAAWRVGATVTLTDEDRSAAARRIVRAWGGGLPMLGGLTEPEVSGLLADAAGRIAPPTGRALATAASPATSSPVPDSTKEVNTWRT